MRDSDFTSDADRERYLNHLRDMFADGRLLLGQFQERLDEVAEARTWKQLQATVRNLPALPSPPVPQPRTARIAASFRRVPLPGRLLAWLLASLCLAMGPAIYNASYYHGLGNERGLATVITVLTLVTGSMQVFVSALWLLSEALG